MAIELGFTSIRKMKNELGATDYDYWCDYFSCEPTAKERMDINSAMIACTVQRSHGIKASIEQFLPKYEERGFEEENLDGFGDKIFRAFGAFKRNKKCRECGKQCGMEVKVCDECGCKFTRW